MTSSRDVFAVRPHARPMTRVATSMTARAFILTISEGVAMNPMSLRAV
jgi:hypothetical protein